MDIVIKGMDMPKGNSVKNLLIYSDGRVYTGHKEDINYFAEELSSVQPEYFDYTDIDEAWEYYAKEQDANLTDNAKQIKDAMWVGYRIGLKSA